MGFFSNILNGSWVTGNPTFDMIFKVIQDPNAATLKDSGIIPNGGVDTSQPWWQGKTLTAQVRTPEEWQALDQKFKAEWQAEQDNLAAVRASITPNITVQMPSAERMSLDKMRGTNQISDYVQQRINQMPNITQMLSPTPQQPSAAPAQPKVQYEDVLNQIKQRYAQQNTGGIAAFAGGGVVKQQIGRV